MKNVTFTNELCENFIGKEGKPVQYTRTTRVDDSKPVSHLVTGILEV